MKIKVKECSYAEVTQIKKPKHKNPRRSLFILRCLMKVLSAKDLKETNFTYSFKNITAFPKEPCLILMNHSAFIDLEMVSSMLFPKPFSIVCSRDGFVGKEWLMRSLGCFPTSKFITEPSLLTDMSYALKKKKLHVLMFPEASYSFDGTCTPLPQRFGTVLRLLKVPVVMITATGAFLRDPLYNMLKKRKVTTHAEVELLFTPEQLKEMTTEQVDEKLHAAFAFDHFKAQREIGITVREDFRADGLERVLYACPHCLAEGKMKGEGSDIFCTVCGGKWHLGENGQLTAEKNQNGFSHIPDWFLWEREQVRKEIDAGTYRLDCGVRILILRDYKAMYDVGRGRLIQDENGFHLSDETGDLQFFQPAIASYSVNADYFWYELGDIICVGDSEMLYYCIPDAAANVSVAKVRFAAEEIYKKKRPVRVRKQPAPSGENDKPE